MNYISATGQPDGSSIHPQESHVYVSKIHPPTKALAEAVLRNGAFIGEIKTRLQISHSLASVSEASRDGLESDPGNLRGIDLKNFDYLRVDGLQFAARVARLVDAMFPERVNLTLWRMPRSATVKLASKADDRFFGATVVDAATGTVLLRVIAMNGKTVHGNEQAVLYLEACAGMVTSEKTETLFMRVS